MKIAFFDAKPYDKPSFEKFGSEKGIKFKYFETKLNEDTVELAKGFDGVCAFVNDTINDVVIDKLNEMGVNVLALRCAGFNNVDMKHAFGKLHVLRVPAYSPYAVAEHTMALLLTSIRRIHKAYIRSRDYNFSLANLTGFDLQFFFNCSFHDPYKFLPVFFVFHIYKINKYDNVDVAEVVTTPEEDVEEDGRIKGADLSAWMNDDTFFDEEKSVTLQKIEKNE